MNKTFLYLTPLAFFCVQPLYAQYSDSDDLARDQRLVIPDQGLNNATQSKAPSAQSLAIAGDTARDGKMSTLEDKLAKMILSSDVDGLKANLSKYSSEANHDQSLVDWGEAIIAASEGRFKDAVNLYRKISAALPDQHAVRLQLAIALFYDNQIVAAKDQFEKLRAQQIGSTYNQITTKYLEAIAKKSKWNFGFGASYVYDKNINNAPPEGTKIVFSNGAEITSSQKPESGKGIQFNVNADKRFQIRDGFFASADFGLYGSMYFDNKKYSDLSARIGIGGGYANATTEISVSPYFNYRWYVDDTENNNGFDFDNKSYGIRTDLSQWLSPKLRYQGALDISKIQYRDERSRSDGMDYIWSNTVLYARGPKQYWFGGFDASRRQNDIESQSYRRLGARIGWGQEWGKGISTRATFGIGKKRFDGEDFFAIKQKSTDYSVGLSIWHRDLHFWDVTPRLTWRYNKVKSNHPFYNYDDNNFFIEFTKSF